MSPSMQGQGTEYLELIQEIRFFLQATLPQKQKIVFVPNSCAKTAPIVKPLELPVEQAPPAITLQKKEEKKVGPFSLAPIGPFPPLDMSSVRSALPSFKASFFSPIVLCYFQEKQKEFVTKLAHALTLEKYFATSHLLDPSELTKEIKKDWPFFISFFHSSLLAYLPKHFHYHHVYPRTNGALFLLHPIEEYEQNNNTKWTLWKTLLAKLPASLSI